MPTLMCSDSSMDDKDLSCLLGYLLDEIRSDSSMDDKDLGKARRILP